MLHVHTTHTSLFATHPADSAGNVEGLECVSGSTTPYSGKWIAPSGSDITQESGDLFDVSVGGERDPGHLTISQAPGSTFTSDHNGVYTCLIPDETGEERMVYVGLYSADYQGKPITAREKWLQN